MSKSCPTCTFELSNDGSCAHCATTCWFCCQPRDQHEAGCVGGEMERQIRGREDALREEGRQQEREAVVAWLQERERGYAAQADLQEREGHEEYEASAAAELAYGRAAAAIQAGKHVTKGAP